MEWLWNGLFHMESITMPSGFHWISYGMWAYPPWIPWTSPHPFHGTSPYGFHETNPDGINAYHICSVLNIQCQSQLCHDGFVIWKTKAKYMLPLAPVNSNVAAVAQTLPCCFFLPTTTIVDTTHIPLPLSTCDNAAMTLMVMRLCPAQVSSCSTPPSLLIDTTRCHVTSCDTAPDDEQ